MSRREFAAAASSCLLVLLTLSPLPAAAAGAAGGRVLSPQESVACTLAEGAYHCNLAALQRSLRQATTVRVETQRLDRTTAGQLRELAGQLGKQVGGADHSADLIFALTPVESAGVNFGPGDHDLATLRIYTSTPEGGHDALIWAETLRGQGDRPWPAQVHLLIEQFRARLGSR